MKASANRRNTYIIRDGYQLRVCRTYAGDEIIAVRHELNAELSRIMGKDWYECKGEVVDTVPYPSWTVKEYVDFINNESVSL